MEENNFIPQDIQNILKNIPEVEQLDLSGFICAVMCDMDLSGEYAEEHIILTKEKLFVLRAEYPYDIITFGGYFKDKKVEIKRKKQSFSVDTYDISLLSEPFVTTYVACGDLSCKYDGGFIRLAMFSNRQSRAVHRTSFARNAVHPILNRNGKFVRNAPISVRFSCVFSPILSPTALKSEFFCSAP